MIIVKDLLNNVPYSQFAIVFCQLLAVLFAEIYFRCVRLRSVNVKCLFTITASHLMLAVLLFNNPLKMVSMMHIYAPVIVGYAWIVRLEWNPWPFTGLLFTHLAYAHWREMHKQYLVHNLDHTIVLMLQTIRLSSLAFDCLGKNYIDDSGGDVDKKKQFKPSLLEYLGFVFFFPGYLSGPAIFYKQWRALIHNTGNSSDHPHHTKRNRWAMKQLGKAGLFAIGHIILKQQFTHHNFPKNTIAKIIHLHLANMGSRFMYYVAWMMAQAALVNFGFERQDCEIVKPWQIEFASEPRQVLLNWNISTDRWLHRYFYTPVRSRLGATMSNVFVKMVSALWHGFYPGYYLMFASYGLVMAASRVIYKSFSWPLPQWTKPYILYLPVWLILDYITPPFVYLSWDVSIAFYRSMYWWGHVVCIIIVVFSTLIGRERRKQE